jgi:hypothetical protein
MDILQTTKENAVTAYNEGSANQKELLINLFGKKVFQLSLTERILTFEDACSVLGLDASKVLKYDIPTDAREIRSNAFDKLQIIAEALNESWKPDWADNSQWKYVTYLKGFKKSVGFSDVDCHRWSEDTFVSSRLCFENSELALFFGNQFLKIHNELQTM